MLYRRVNRGKREKAPCEILPNGDFCVFACRLFAMWKPIIKVWCVFTWQTSTPPGEDTTNGRRKHATYKCVLSLHGWAKGRHAKTHQIVILAVFHMVTFPLPDKDTTNSRRKRNTWKVAYIRVAGQKVAWPKNEKVTIWRVFAWRLIAFLPRNYA